MESKAELEARLTMNIGQLLDQAISVMVGKGKEFSSNCVYSYMASGSRGLDEMRGVKLRNWYLTGEVISKMKWILKDKRDEILAILTKDAPYICKKCKARKATVDSSRGHFCGKCDDEDKKTRGKLKSKIKGGKRGLSIM